MANVNDFQTPAKILVAESEKWLAKKQELLKTIVTTAQPTSGNSYIVEAALLDRLREFIDAA